MTNQEKSNITIKKLGNSQIEIVGEIEWKKLNNHKALVLKGLSENLEIPGFRKGHVSEDIVKKHIGEDEIMNRSAEKTLQEAYPKILAENNIEAIGKPFISITKLAEGNPLGFKIITSVMPEIELPDYRSIAKKVNSRHTSQGEVGGDNNITDEEVKTAIKTIREQWARFEIFEKSKKEGKEVKPEEIKIEEKDLPKFNDEFVKKLSSEYKNVDDFRKRLKENMQKEKTMRNKEKNRIESMEGILEKTKITVPEIIIESELQKMMFQFEEDLKRAKMDKKFYLANIKKTEEELKEEWKKVAEKKAKIQLILNRIAKKEKIKPDKEKVEHEVKHIKEHRKDIDEDRATAHIEGLMMNEAVMEFLESQ